MMESLPSSSPVPIAPDERRRFVRIRKEVSIECRVVSRPSVPMEGLIRDLSSGGMMLRTENRLTLGAIIEVRARLPEQNVDLTLAGRVVWCEHSPLKGRYLSGICLIGLDEAQRRNVLAVIGRDRQEASDGERRHFIRLARHIYTEYRVEGHFLGRRQPAHAQDISLGGALIVAEEPVVAGQILALRIHLDDGVPKPLDMTAQTIESHGVRGAEGVRRCFVHLRFIRITQDSHERLVAYIAKSLQSHPPTPWDNTASSPPPAHP